MAHPAGCCSGLLHLLPDQLFHLQGHAESTNRATISAHKAEHQEIQIRKTKKNKTLKTDNLFRGLLYTLFFCIIVKLIREHK